MFLGRSEKKKKHPMMAMCIGALSLYGAYSMISCMKDFMCEKMGSIMNKMGMGKCKCGEGGGGSCDCGDECDCQ